MGSSRTLRHFESSRLEVQSVPSLGMEVISNPITTSKAILKNLSLVDTNFKGYTSVNSSLCLCSSPCFWKHIWHLENSAWRREKLSGYLFCGLRKQNLSFLDKWAQPLYGGQKQGSMMVGTMVKVEWIMIMTLEESARYSTSNLGLCRNFTAVNSPIIVWRFRSGHFKVPTSAPMKICWRSWNSRPSA